MNVKKSAVIMVAVMTGLAVAQCVSAIEVNGNDIKLNIGGHLQTYGHLEHIKDPYRKDNRIYLFQKEIRLKISGDYSSAKFYIQYELGPAGYEGGNINLLDAHVSFPLMDRLNLRVGQFKVPYSRERLLDSADMQYAYRSINTVGFNVGRDVGVAAYGNIGNVFGSVGIFTGGGIGVPVRNIPQRLGVPMVSLRVGFNDNLDQDVFNLRAEDFSNQEPGHAFYVNAVYSEDSLVGHGGVLTHKDNDLSLFLQSRWNPFIDNYGILKQIGADYSMQRPLGNYLLVVNAEVNAGTYKNVTGEINLSGGVAGASLYVSEVVGFGIRGAYLVPDTAFAYDNGSQVYPLFDKKMAIKEITPALTLKLKDKGITIKMDAPIGLDVPVVQENGLGTYNLMTQPGQANYVANGGVSRKTTVSARIIFQFVF